MRKMIAKPDLDWIKCIQAGSLLTLDLYQK